MMVGDKDKLTISKTCDVFFRCIMILIMIRLAADFGLAKQKKEFSVMKSTVGTMLYWW